MRVSLSKKNAERLLGIVDRTYWAATSGNKAAIDALRDALAPKRRKPAAIATRKAKATKKATKKERRADVRAQVMERAEVNGGLCECGCGKCLDPQSFLFAPTMDHFFGRAREESLETCWALTQRCHDAKSFNAPSAAEWLQRFIAHCDLHNYHAEADRARSRLEGICAVREREAGR